MPFYAVQCALTEEILAVIEGAESEDPGSVLRWYRDKVEEAERDAMLEIVRVEVISWDRRRDAIDRVPMGG